MILIISIPTWPILISETKLQVQSNKCCIISAYIIKGLMRIIILYMDIYNDLLIKII